MTSVHPQGEQAPSSRDTRWMALGIVCLGALMMVLDTTIVNVALPSIRADLGFSEASLAWVVNAYMLTFGGFLLLGGRLGDLYGQKTVFLAGIVIFTIASIGCGVAQSQLFLLVARALQGFGGAIVSAVALSLILNLFTEPRERAKAMGVYGFVGAGGGSVGVFLGGVLTNAFDWHWVFLVNIPIGILVFVLCWRLLPKLPGTAHGERLDIAGAVTITTAMLTAVYAIVNGNTVGWTSSQTLALLGVAALLLAVFVWIELRVEHPLMPLALFRSRNLTVANTIGVLWSAGMFAWFFLCALYLQLVLGYSPLEVGMSFLPGNLIMASFSLGLSAKIVMRFGTRTPLVVGLSVLTVALLLFSMAPIDGNYVTHVLPAMILLGLGAGTAFNPVLLSAMNDVSKEDSGLASGMLNTSFMMGGSLGLAVLASVASAQTASALADAVNQREALLAGYQLAFRIGAVFTLSAAMLAMFVLRPAMTAQSSEESPLVFEHH